MQVLIYSDYYQEHKKLYDDIFKLTQPIGDIYPNYRNWYYHTFLEDLKQGHRLYAIATHHMVITGCCLMKNTANEKKICTLFVGPQYRRQGIGSDLVRSALTELGPHPFLTVSDGQLSTFIPFLSRFGFQMKMLPRKNAATPREALFYRPTPRLIQKSRTTLPDQVKDKTKIRAIA